MDQRTNQDIVIEAIEQLADSLGGMDSRVPRYRIIHACKRVGLDRDAVEHTLAELFAVGILARIEAIETESYIPFGETEHTIDIQTVKVYYAFPDYPLPDYD